MKLRIIPILVTVVLLPFTATAEDASKTGTAAAQFLKIPVGAKAAAMGSTFASVADDPTALYWNPAGIAGIQRISGSLSYSQWIAGLKHSFAGMVFPIGSQSSIGLSATSLKSDRIEQTTIDLPEGTGTFFDALDIAIGATYAQSMTDNVAIGATLKYVSQRIWNETAETFACDLGVTLKTGLKDLRVGLLFQNFGPGLTMSGRELIRQVDQDPASTSNPFIETAIQTQEWSLPTSYRLSTSMSIIGDEGLMAIPNSRFLLAIDAVHPNDNPEHYSIGGEYEFAGTFAVRGGYVFNTDQEGMTLGAGLKIPLGVTMFSFDYAYAAFGLLGSVQYFTLSAAL